MTTDAEPSQPSQPSPQPREPPPKPYAHALMARIRFLADHSERVIFGDHARDRMDERDITDGDVLRVLRLGEMKGGIEAGEDAGEWKCKVVAKPKGSRLMGVVTIVMMDEHLFIKTVEWED